MKLSHEWHFTSSALSATHQKLVPYWEKAEDCIHTNWRKGYLTVKVRRKSVTCLTVWLDSRKITFLKNTNFSGPNNILPRNCYGPSLHVFCLMFCACPEIARFTDKAEITQRDQIGPSLLCQPWWCVFIFIVALFSPWGMSCYFWFHTRPRWVVTFHHKTLRTVRQKKDPLQILEDQPNTKLEAFNLSYWEGDILEDSWPWLHLVSKQDLIKTSSGDYTAIRPLPSFPQSIFQ